MKVERSIDIPAPRELVWQLAHDPEARATWDVRVAAVGGDGGAVVGAPFAITWRTPIVESVAEAFYVDVDAPNRSVARVGDATMPIVPPGVSTWLFAERSGGTRLTLRFESDPGAVSGLAGLLVRLLIRRDAGRSLRNLRRMALERGAIETTQVYAAAGD